MMMFAATVVIASAILVVAVSAAAPQQLCVSCHEMRPFRDALATTVHAEANCGDCHLPGIALKLGMARRVLTEMLPASLISSRVNGVTRGVPSTGCRSCHQGLSGGTVENGGIRVRHQTCTSGKRCTDCHGSIAHGQIVRVNRSYTMEGCTSCHRASSAPSGCDTCHGAKTERARLRRGPWQITHGAEWSQTHGLGSLQSCASCHPSDYCVRCHEVELPHAVGFGQTHGDEAKKDISVCDSCHDREALCFGCHLIEMPHPTEFLPEHPTSTDGVTDPECSRCHEVEDCIACHEGHVHPGNAVIHDPGEWQ
ncbi:MAG: hypothetical protein EG825_16530 [Rhodocyclaceae bacterium]|nr:hypothetical protein [Rhodocyclaceae bacterium]